MISGTDADQAATSAAPRAKEAPRLVHLWTAAAWLEMDRDEALQLVESGRIEFAFDIGIGETREIRVLSLSIFDFISGKQRQEWGQIAKFIHPPERAILTPAQIQTVWSCKDEHVRNLLRAGLLSVQAGSQMRRGPNGAAKIIRTSALEFLKQRRLL